MKGLAVDDGEPRDGAGPKGLQPGDGPGEIEKGTGFKTKWGKLLKMVRKKIFFGGNEDNSLNVMDRGKVEEGEEVLVNLTDWMGESSEVDIEVIEEMGGGGGSIQEIGRAHV